MNASKDTLVVAGGGGGDALAALMIARTLNLDPTRTAYATIVWERTLYDARPGPRSPEDFLDLKPVGQYNHRIGPNSALQPPSQTFVPRLAETFGVHYYLMDIARGAWHVQQQIAELHALHEFDTILVVDVGGDILARGDEPNLRSPTADSLTLAGMHNAPVDVYVAVCGLGLDGELTDEDIADVKRDLTVNTTYRTSPAIPAEVAADYIDVFRWLPSEVSGMTCAAALGYRGTAEIRSSGLRVDLSDDSPRIRIYAYEDVLNRNAVARAALDTTSLDEAADVVSSFGLTPEMTYERRSAQQLAQQIEAKNGTYTPGAWALELETYGASVQEDDVSYLSARRIARVLGLNRTRLNRFTSYLSDTYPDRFQPPVWVCQPKSVGGDM